MSFLEKTAFTLGVLMILPVFVMAYGSLLGHSYTTNQWSAACCLAIISLLPIAAAVYLMVEREKDL